MISNRNKDRDRCYDNRRSLIDKKSSSFLCKAKSQARASIQRQKDIIKDYSHQNDQNNNVCNAFNIDDNRKYDKRSKEGHAECFQKL